MFLITERKKELALEGEKPVVMLIYFPMVIPALFHWFDQKDCLVPSCDRKSAEEMS